MRSLAVLALAIACAVAALALLRRSDRRTDAAIRARLLARQPPAPPPFDPAMLAGLPEPAQRFFRFAIAPGTPLRTVAEITMAGDFGLGTKAAPKYQPMTAWQVHALPDGFVWQMSSGSIAGSDGLSPEGSWTRFRLFGLIPVARQGFTDDHRRSAFARAVAEAVFWTPAAVLPGPGITWDAVGPDAARVTVRHGDLTQEVTLTLAPDGRPLSMVMPRWSNANPAKRWQVQPFGATFGAVASFQGFSVPVEVAAGNHFGTPDWFPFFRARVTDLRFPSPG